MVDPCLDAHTPGVRGQSPRQSDAAVSYAYSPSKVAAARSRRWRWWVDPADPTFTHMACRTCSNRIATAHNSTPPAYCLKCFVPA